MKNNKIPLTEKIKKRIQDELNILNSIEKQRIIDSLSEARDKNDIEDNNEYNFLIEEYEKLKNRIMKLENYLINSYIINKDDIDENVVSVFSTVKVRNCINDKIFTFTIVPETEIDVRNGKISMNSPIGLGLLNKHVGETVVIETPIGKIKYEIIDIKNDLNI